MDTTLVTETAVILLGVKPVTESALLIFDRAAKAAKARAAAPATQTPASQAAEASAGAGHAAGPSTPPWDGPAASSGTPRGPSAHGIEHRDGAWECRCGLPLGAKRITARPAYQAHKAAMNGAGT